MDALSMNAAQSYAASRPATAPLPGAKIERQFGKVAEQFTQQLQGTEQIAQASMTGNADPHALVEALAQSELAVETVVSVRDKVVEAYQEILRMPV